MKILLDTSILVAAMVEAHPAHERALPWLQRIKAGTDVGFVAAHSIAELYAILSILPVQPRISPVIANKLIQQDVFDICEIVPLSVQDYTIDRAIAGKTIIHPINLFHCQPLVFVPIT